MTKEQTFDINEAKQEYFILSDGRGVYNRHKPFSKYSHAYVITNENLREVSKLIKDKKGPILTVAGSGDQPIFFSLTGNKNIDAFDISFCSKAIMDIKTSAIQNLNINQYKQLLADLHTGTNFQQIPNMGHISRSLPNDTKTFIQQMNMYEIFGNGRHPRNYATYMPTSEEYNYMKKIINKPFKFIWEDLENINLKIDKEYDVIHLSNIFEYKNAAEIESTIIKLKPYINKNGFIILQTGYFNANNQTFSELQKKFQKWAKFYIAKFDKTKATSEASILLQKTK